MHIWDRFEQVEPKPGRWPRDLTNSSRNDLAAEFALQGYKIGVEIGVEQGKFSEVLLTTIPGLRLTCVDAWTAYRGYRDHVSQTKMDGFYEDAKKRLLPLGATIVRKFSMDAVKEFRPNTLDFVYIDGNHGFDWVMQDLIEWSRRVRSGGMVAGHDYIRRLREPVHVIQATHAYTDAHGITEWWTCGGQNKETRSFFWVKP